MSVKSLRKQLGLTQVEFAKRLNTTQATVSRWERELVAPSPLGSYALRSVFPALKDQRSTKEQLEAAIKLLSDHGLLEAVDFLRNHLKSENVQS